MRSLKGHNGSVKSVDIDESNPCKIIIILLIFVLEIFCSIILSILL